MTVSAQLLPLTVDPIPLRFLLLTEDPIPLVLLSHLPPQTFLSLPLELTVLRLHHITITHHHHQTVIFLHQTLILWEMIFIPHLLSTSHHHLPLIIQAHPLLATVHPLLNMVHPLVFLLHLTSCLPSFPRGNPTFSLHYFPLFHETRSPLPPLPPRTFPRFLAPQRTPLDPSVAAIS